MLLSTLFSYITTLDSFSINVGGDDDGELAARHYTKTINAINLALIEMYTEFPVKERGMTIQLYEHITEYYLDSAYAQTNVGSAEVYKYIADTANNPFLDDVIHVEKIMNELGEEFYLNNEKEPLSLYTPAYNIVQHPYPGANNSIFVTYRALPKTILESVDPVAYTVDLPPQLLNLFLVFVNHKLLSSVNKQESVAKYGEYIALLQKAKTTGLFLADDPANRKLEARGWA